MDNTLLLSLQIEYETTPHTLEAICQQHDIDINEVTGHETWTKRSQQTAQTLPIVPPEAPIVYTPEERKSSAVMLEDIATFKRSLLDKAQDFIVKHADYAETRELKDMAKIVTDLEASYKDNKDSGTTINVLVQNITEKFKDDC